TSTISAAPTRLLTGRVGALPRLSAGLAAGHAARTAYARRNTCLRSAAVPGVRCAVRHRALAPRGANSGTALLGVDAGGIATAIFVLFCAEIRDTCRNAWTAVPRTATRRARWLRRAR